VRGGGRPDGQVRGEAASVSLVVHSVEAVIAEKATGLSSVKVRGIFLSNEKIGLLTCYASVKLLERSE